MKVLVTGGGGFLGSALLTALASEHEVVSLDHGRHYDELRGMLSRPVALERGDAYDRELVGKTMRGVDALVHLAGLAGERRCTGDPLRGMLSNVYATHVLLEAARRESVKRVIFASSYWVYSTFTPRELPIREDSELATDSIYGAQKVASERMIEDAGIPFANLRIAALYGFGTGIGSQWEGLLGKLVGAGLAGRPLQVFGDGEQRFDLVHVDDVVRAIVALLERPVLESQALNVGGGAAVSVLEVARIVQALLCEAGHDATIELREAPPGKVWPDKWLALDRIRGVLGRFPFTSLEQGIAATYRGFERAFAR